MKLQSVIFLTALCSSYMWRSSFCDSTSAAASDTVVSPSRTSNGPNTHSQGDNENKDPVVNSNEVKTPAKKVIKQEKQIKNPDVIVPKFNETIRKFRRRNTVENIDKQQLRSSQSEVPVENVRIIHKIEQTISDSIQGVGDDQNNLVDEQTKSAVPIIKTEEIIPVLSESEKPKDSSSSLTVDKPQGPRSSESQDASESSHPQHSDAMPSFDEWKKMMLAEQEKGGHKVLVPGPPGKKVASQKRRRNYASYECGAKIVASNSEAEGTSRILNEMVDEYMLNPCQAKIWFVLEMCESVQTSQIEIANFELFSSCPKDFAVYSSDNFPTRDWVLLGSFTAAEQRVLQSFQLNQEGFGKFIKVEFSSHYGKEHYCPLSLVHLFGTSMVDEYEEMETLSEHSSPHDDELDRLDLPEDKGATNIFGSATDAVYNIVKKAAQVLVQHQAIEGEDTVGDENLSELKACKLNDGKCNDTNKTFVSSLPSVELLVSVGSIHRTLFHHLKHCEQCVKESHHSYHSVSEPQCRFFQAALGPVLFTTICEWFRDHHLPTLQQMPYVHHSENASSTRPKPTSPPPSVIQVIVDTNYSESIEPPPFRNESTLVLKSDGPIKESSGLSADPGIVTSATLSPSIIVQSNIEPTKTVSYVDGGTLLDLSDVKTDSSFIKPDIDGSLLFEDNLISDDFKIPEASTIGEDDLYVLSSTFASTPSSDVSSVEILNETSSLENDENDTLMDSSTVTIIASSIDVEDFVDVSGEDKFTDTKDSNIKLETVMIGGAGGVSSQKESVFVRMNNRIKALELNMSLSSQYLQELSQRYRRQMEEMQRAFNRTIGTLNDTAKKAAERDVKQQDVINTLQSQVSNLTLVVDRMNEERISLFKHTLQIHLLLMLAEAIIMITIMSLCVRRISSMRPLQQSEITESNTTATSPPTIASPQSCRKRRNSAGSQSSPSMAKVKKRSSSEEILATGNDLLNVEAIPPVPPVPPPKPKKRNRKKKGMQRSLSNPSMSPSKGASTSQMKDPKQEESAAGIIFTHAKTENTCENCNKNNATKCYESRAANANKRKSQSPFKNLTNGDLNVNGKASVDEYNLPKSKDKFSFKKFLKLQKRESI